MPLEKGPNLPEKDDGASPVPEWIKNNPEWRKQESEKLKKQAEQSESADHQEIENLRGGLGIESKEGQENKEFERLVEKFKEGLEEGKVAYKITTKIPKGKSYRGYTEENKGVELYHPYSVEKEGDNAVKPFNGVRSDGWNWQKFGDVLIILCPIKKHQKTIEMVTEEKKTFFGGIKKVQVQKEVGKDVPVTLIDCGVEDATNEALYSLDVQYSVDTSEFVDKRGISNAMRFTMPEGLARSLSEEIVKNPKKLFEFLKAIEPELMILAPIKKTKPDDPEESAGFVFYDLENSRPDYQTIEPTAVMPREVVL